MTLNRTLSATGQEGAVRWVDTLRSVFTLPLQLGFVIIGFGAAGMAYGLSVATFLVIPVFTYFLNIEFTIPTQDTLVSMWDYAKYETISGYIGMTYDRYDVFLLSIVLSPAVVGLYEVAAKLVSPGSYISSVTSANIMARVSNHNDEQLIRRDVENALAFASVLSIPIFFGALAIPKRIIVTVFGPEYRGGWILMIGLALYFAFRTQSQIFQNTLSGLDMPDLNMKILMGTTLINIILGIVLVFPFGAVGVVAATVAAGLLRYLVSVYVVHSILEITVVKKSLKNQIIAGVIMFVVVEGTSSVFLVESWVALIAVVGLGAVAYFTILFTIDPHTRTTSRNIISEAVQ